MIPCTTPLDVNSGAPAGDERRVPVQEQLSDLGKAGCRSALEWWHEMDKAILSDLPMLNAAVLADCTRIGDLIDRFRPLLTADDLHHFAEPAISPRMAREIIGTIAFPCASIDTHLQRRGVTAGAGYRMFPLLDGLLEKLGRAAHHPPTHSHLTYWIYNDRDLPRSFTGTEGEIHFNRAVNLTDRKMSFICALIAPIADGRIGLNDPEAAARIEQAIAAYDDIHKAFIAYKRPKAAGCPIRMGQKDFMTGMRPYLVETEIKGARHTGPNAANVTSWIGTDFLIGFREPFYNDLLRDRCRSMMPEESLLVESFMTSSSLPDAIARHIGIDIAGLLDAQPLALLERCKQLSERARNTIKSFGRLAAIARATSKIHFSYIEHYVENASKLLTDAEKQIALVREGKGVSGTTIEEGARRINVMRESHPVTSKLIQLGKSL